MADKKAVRLNCAMCNEKRCYNQGEMIREVDTSHLAEYDDPDIDKIFRASTALESEGYMKLNRLQELIAFSQKMEFKHIGIAFCIGLAEEAKILAKILKQHFKVSSVCCKVCAEDKDERGLVKIHDDKKEVMCNPVGQAMLLNDTKTDLNLICGLCVGHDILFTKYSEAPVSTFIVKDRVLGHNPAASLYSRYYRKILLPDVQ
ncbi:DUF1847 domain-containing protein [candidate division KSB1 bacterium]